MLDRVVLAGVGPGFDKQENDPDVQEMKGLIEAGGLELVVMLQSRQKPDRATYIGRARVRRAPSFGEGLEIGVLFNVDLSPLQIRNLEEALEVDID